MSVNIMIRRYADTRTIIVSSTAPQPTQTSEFIFPVRDIKSFDDKMKFNLKLIQTVHSIKYKTVISCAYLVLLGQ